MKFLDKVQVINERLSYTKENVRKNMIGTIIDAEIRDDCFNVIFVDEKPNDKNFILDDKTMLEIKDDIICPINIRDLKLIKNNNCSDEKILESIPLHNKKWWCKVEDGYITNLLGEKKNKIPYDYNS